jgi:hypothetical protein
MSAQGAISRQQIGVDLLGGCVREGRFLVALGLAVMFRWLLTWTLNQLESTKISLFVDLIHVNINIVNKLARDY